KMKTDLELALECIINIYHQYAIKNPIDDYLSRDEFSELLKETPNTSTDDYINTLFTRADGNHDGRLKFTEFLSTLSLVTIDAHNRSHNPAPCMAGSQDNSAAGSQLSSAGWGSSPS
uniref:EF-hand domain-containing protein n=1 Tax=Strix occidentalis caurina TaxID=311401 RepID=A0A8D0EVU0_STROC